MTLRQLVEEKRDDILHILECIRRIEEDTTDGKDAFLASLHR